MKTKLFLSAICAILLPLTCFGKVFLSELHSSKEPVSNDIAKTLLSKVYLHNHSLLNNAQVTITMIRVIDSWMTLSNHECKNNNVSVFICAVKTDNLPLEYYAVCVKDNNVIDGALLGHEGDSEILKLKFPHDKMVYKPETTINFDFKDDTVKVIRKYQFFSTARGGKWFHKDGVIRNTFIINDDGTLKQLSVTTSAVREDGDANYLNKNRKPTTHSNTTGEFFPLGMNVLIMAQTPISKKIDIEALNLEANETMKRISHYDEDAPKTPETLSIMEFAKWSFNLGMRHSDEFLTWIVKELEQEHFTYFFEAVASENENGELEWLKENINNLKDKKTRKWWQKWIKENINGKE